MKLLAIFGLFLLPLVSAYLLYYHSDWRPQTRSNNGTLVSPARPLSAAGFFAPDGELYDERLLRDRWTLLMVGPSECGTHCRERLHMTRQLHTALGRRASRIQRVYVATDRERIEALQSYAQENHPGLKLLIDPQGQGPDLPDFFARATAGQVEGLRIYLLDPLGNWLMYYEPDATPREVHQDLKRLLKLSRIG